MWAAIFLPDGTLMMPVGDAFHFREEAQTLDNHFGKIVRLNDDGSVPEDNPFVGQEGALQQRRGDFVKEEIAGGGNAGDRRQGE